MTESTKSTLKILGAVTIACLGLAAFSSTDEGSVVDVNGRPVKGAYVVAHWTASVAIAVESRTQCYQLEGTTTDENGHFRVSRFSRIDPLKRDRKRYVEIYMPGYQLKSGPDQDVEVFIPGYGIKSGPSEELEFVITPFVGVKAAQLRAVDRYYRGAGCGYDNAMLPMLRARYADCNRLAAAKEEKKICDSLLFSVESIEFGYPVAQKRMQERNMPEPIIAVTTSSPRFQVPSGVVSGQCTLSNNGGKPESNCNPVKEIPGKSYVPKGSE